MTRRSSLVCVLFFCAASFVSSTDLNFRNLGFERNTCYKRTLELLHTGLLSANDEVFHRDHAGLPMNNEENLTLTRMGCNRLCGPRMIWYKDIGPRLSVWLIPILLLLSNVELSPLDKRRFLAIIHLLGDPIDSIWSLIHKLAAWDRCYRLAERYNDICGRCKRIVGTVFAGFEEVEGPRIDSQNYYNNLIAERDLTTNFQEWRKAAVKLADSRTDEFARTCLAIFLYCFQLTASFVKEVGGGGSGSPPGGRIATGVFLSWLIPTVLLSNAMGNLPSRRTSYDIISRFAEHTGDPVHIPHSPSKLLPGYPRLSRKCQTDYFHSLGWSGAIYTFRPWKCRRRGSEQGWTSSLLVLLLAVSPVCIAMIGGFVILWYSLPIGPNCRHTWLTGIFFAWILSAFLTWVSNNERFATGKYHWRFVLIKDACIAIPSILVIILSACGMFNFCNCWAGLRYGRQDAHVPLRGDPFYERMGRTVYPTVVGVFVALQLLLFGLISFIWRRGLKLARWSETLRSEEWARVTTHQSCKCLHRRRPSRLDSDCPMIKNEEDHWR